MWVTKCIATIDAKMKALQEPISNQEKCEEFAADAYKYCTELFGPPADPHKPYRLINGPDEVSSCSYALGLYTITLSPQCETLEEQCMMIGHEMYHRFTMHRKGLRQQVWVDELLAFLTSHSFLKRQGYLDYADSYVRAYKNSDEKLNVKKLREYPRPSFYNRLKNIGLRYYDEFYYDIAQLEIALKAVLRSKDLYPLLKATSLDLWIDSLPEEKQYSVCRILEVSSVGRKPPTYSNDINHFSHALRAKGDSEAAVAELQLLTELQPTNGVVFAYLACAQYYAGEDEAALSNYLKAHDLRFDELWLASSIGAMYYRKKDYASATVWYQKAAECKSDWAKAYYWLGCSLNKQGNLQEAHDAWKRAVTLRDEEFTTLAQKAIEEYPYETLEFHI